VADSSESSDEVVGVGRLPAAIARRSERRGSWVAASDVAIVRDRAVALMRSDEIVVFGVVRVGEMEECLK
jgi:hypothetical protein